MRSWTKKTSYGDSFRKVINKIDKQVTTLLANMTLEIDHNEIHNEIDLTPSIDLNICTLTNES